MPLVEPLVVLSVVVLKQALLLFEHRLPTERPAVELFLELLVEPLAAGLLLAERPVVELVGQLVVELVGQLVPQLVFLQPAELVVELMQALLLS